jgi:G3E family GTPase
VLRATHGHASASDLFGAALFDPARKTPDVQAWLRTEAHEHHGHAHTHDDASDRGIRSFCLTFDEPLPWQAVSGWLTALRQWRGEDLLRVKGIVHLREEDLPIAIHGVHHIFHPPVQLNAWSDADRRSRIVFITRRLEQSEVEAAWAAVTEQAPSG